MHNLVIYFAFFISAYLIGSIPNGYIITKIKLNKDIRKLGKWQNMGATNVFASVSPLAGIITLTLDILKGFIPVYIAKVVGINQYTILLVGILTIIGHIFPVYIGFKGGTGMATTVGILLALMPSEILFIGLLWGVLIILFKKPSLMGLFVIMLLPLLSIYMNRPQSVIIAAFTISIVDIIMSSSSKKHIKRMIKGAEYDELIGKLKKMKSKSTQ